MWKKAFLTSALLTASLHVWGQSAATVASVERLLEASQASKIVDAMAAQTPQMAQDMARQFGVKIADRPQFEAYMNRAMQVFGDEFQWSRQKGQLIEIYLRHYTEEEIQGMIAFYESPVGRGMLEKAPEVARDTAQMSQQLVGRAIPRIRALFKESQVEKSEGRKEVVSPAVEEKK